ncbi:MAG: response regulator transcription factor [bacterium]
MSYNILLVEDDPNFAAMMSEHLTNAGYNVRQSMTVNDGLASIKSELPHLAVIDLNLPDRSGSSLLMDVRKNPATKSLPIIVLTGSGSETDYNYLLRMGADAFLFKSSPPEKCIVTIEALFRRLEIDGLFIRMENAVIDRRGKSVHINGVRMKNISPQEFDFLSLLAESSPKPVTSKEIYSRLMPVHKNFDAYMTVSSLTTKLSRDSGIKISGDLTSGYSLRN